MADVGVRSDDRAQLLIVAAIGIAVLLTVLALALNTAVYGTIHVSQTDNSLHDERGAVQYQSSVQRAVSGFASSNAGKETEYDDLESDLRSDVDRWSELSKIGYAGDGVATRASVTNVTFESRVIQDEHGTFEDRSARSEWIVASEVSAIDAFEMRLHDEALVVTDDCTSAECFTLEVEGDDGGVWRLVVNTPSSEPGVTITVQSSDGSTDTCETVEQAASVDVTAGVFTDETGTECSFTSFVDDGGISPPYTLSYANADNVTGTYDLTASGKLVESTIADDDRYGTTGSPRIEPRISTADVSVEYQSSDLTYRTEIWVEGGENGD